MKLIFLYLSLLLLTATSFAQDNPYEIFGYKAKVEYKENKLDKLRVPVNDPDKVVKVLEFDFEKRVIRLLDVSDSTVQKVAITQDKLLRWSTVDPLAEKYMPYSPYAYVGNNPITRIDPNGMEWADDKAKEEAKRTEAQINKRNESIGKQNERINSRIEKAESRGNSDKAARLSGKVADNNQRIAVNNETIGALHDMGNVEGIKFRFSNEVTTSTRSDGTETQTTTLARDKDGVYVVNTSGSLGNKAHEITHGGQVANKLVGLAVGSQTVSFMAPGQTKLSLEVPGYKANYGITGKLPFDGEVSGLNDPNFPNVVLQHLRKK